MSTAAAIVATALELYKEKSDGLQTLLATPAVRDGLRPHSAPRELLIHLSISIARDVLPVWSDRYPDLRGPVVAVAAAEAWSVCPCASHAEAASGAAKQAIDQGLSVWHKPPKAAAWSGRTAAWAADSPTFGWPVIPAIAGACFATTPDRVIAVAELFLSR